MHVCQNILIRSRECDPAPLQGFVCQFVFFFSYFLLSSVFLYLKYRFSGFSGLAKLDLDLDSGFEKQKYYRNYRASK